MLILGDFLCILIHIHMNQKFCFDKRILYLALLVLPLLLLVAFSNIASSRKITKNSTAYEVPTASPAPSLKPTPKYSGPAVRAICLDFKKGATDKTMELYFLKEVEPVSKNLDIYAVYSEGYTKLTELPLKPPFADSSKPILTFDRYEKLEAGIAYTFIGFQGEIITPTPPMQSQGGAMQQTDSPVDEILEYVLHSASKQAVCKYTTR